MHRLPALNFRIISRSLGDKSQQYCNVGLGPPMCDAKRYLFARIDLAGEPALTSCAEKPLYLGDYGVSRPDPPKRNCKKCSRKLWNVDGV